MKEDEYYIISDKKTGKMIITKSYFEIYDFIIYNLNSKVRVIASDIKPKILDRRLFLNDFYKNANKKRYFELVKIMIKLEYNRIRYLNKKGLVKEYRSYLKSKERVNKNI